MLDSVRTYNHSSHRHFTRQPYRQGERFLLDEHDDTPNDSLPPTSESSGPDGDVDGGIERVSLERIAHYEIEGVAARGGEGVVYRATDSTLQRTVALKVIDDATYADRLIGEARNTSKLSHPGIAAVYQAGVDDATGCAFVAFEWVEGSTLRNHLRGNPAEPADLLRYTEKVSAAVAYAHEQGLVHGDLKADNVVLTVGEGTVKLIDFGLSTTVEGFDEDEIWGTPAYMAPELFDGAPRSITTDLFALGVLLYEIATGELPFDGTDGDEAKVRRAHEHECKNVRDWEPNVPGPLAQTIHSLISIDPAQRGPTAAEVARWARHARNPAGRSARWLVPVLLLIGVAVGAYATRDRWLTNDPKEAKRAASGDSKSTSVAEAERVPERIVIGTWLGPESETARTALLRDLLIMNVNGEDPGSALIDLSVEDKSAQSTKVTGYWESVDGQFTAVWTGRDGVSRSVDGGSGLVDLATAIVDDIGNAPRDRTRLTNVRATTLCSSLPALEAFVAGVRAAEAGDVQTALAKLQEAKTTAGTFPEATAWEAAIRLSRGEFDRAATSATLLRDRESRLCQVLGDTLTTPTRDRRSRWERSHRVARRVDLTLDLQDPRSSDASLMSRLRGDAPGDVRHYTQALVSLAYRYGEMDDAQSAFRRYEAYNDSDDGWRVQFYRWRLEAPPTTLTPPAGWMLRLRGPVAFLTIPFFLQDGDLDAALDRSAEEFGPVEAYAAAAAALAIGGRFNEALELAGELSRPLDRGWGERLRAAIHILAGDPAAAAVALHNARDHDPYHPKTLFLLGYIETDPFAVEPLGEPEVSEFTRWHNRFSALRSARASEEPAEGLTLTESVRWVDSELRVTDWPEVSYFAWLERIRLTALTGERDAALQELAKFRRWWPKDRAPSSRLSVEAKRIEVEIEGPQ